VRFFYRVNSIVEGWVPWCR